MSNICKLLKMLAMVVERDGHLPLLYCSSGASTYATEPAPYFELTCLERGSIPRLRMGAETFAMPENHLAAHNVHFGNKASSSAKFRGKCVFFDLRAYREFDFLAEKPFFESIHPQGGTERMLAAIDKLAACNRLAAWQPRSYPVSKEFLSQRGRCALSLPDRLFIKSSLLEILALALEAWGAKEDGGRGMALPAGVQRALDFLHLNYARRGLGLGEIAAAACLDASHLGRVFKQAVGRTPMRYLRAVRTAHAAMMLEQTSLPLSAIAEECGFANQFLFSRLFKAEHNQAPLAYRKKIGAFR